MNPRIESSLVMFFLLLICLSPGVTMSSNALDFLHKGGVGANSRKLLGFDAVLDYDYAGPNIKHDPRARRGGGGGKSR